MWFIPNINSGPKWLSTQQVLSSHLIVWKPPSAGWPAAGPAQIFQKAHLETGDDQPAQRDIQYMCNIIYNIHNLYVII